MLFNAITIAEQNTYLFTHPSNTVTTQLDTLYGTFNSSIGNQESIIDRQLQIGGREADSDPFWVVLSLPRTIADVSGLIGSFLIPWTTLAIKVYYIGETINTTWAILLGLIIILWQGATIVALLQFLMPGRFNIHIIER